MKSRVAALLMAVLLVVYLILMASGVPLGIVMGLALIIFPLIAAWAVGRELMFGVQTQKLVHILDAEGGLPVDDLPHRPSGRPLRDAADAAFPSYRSDVESQPTSWRAWFRLGLAYDASGDRKRARHALREAIRLYRASKHATA
jgi:cytochrome c-type biogenesis protein CcmH/NrfG